MNWLLIAGGAFLGAFSAPKEPEMMNHTLRGDMIPAREVVCRNMWGTPMLPDGKGGYSLIAPINPQFIAESLVQPPKPLDGPASRYVFHPAALIVQTTVPAAVQ
jgi:hypothetical protein